MLRLVPDSTRLGGAGRYVCALRHPGEAGVEERVHALES